MIMAHMRQRWFVTLLAATMFAASACTASDEDQPVVGLITKQEANPYWVSLRETAQQEASRLGARLITATGSSDVDVSTQAEAIEMMTEKGVDGILIAPTDSTRLNEAITKARAKSIPVIALDTPVEPESTVNAYYATDNEQAGRLVGEYARAKADALGLTPKVVTLDLAPGISSGQARHRGFLAGFGITDEHVVASEDTRGERAKGKEAMTKILATHPGVNVVYTVNEQAALGALATLTEKRVDLDRIILVSIDGGCEAMKEAVRPGHIDATATQYPQNMAREGVKAIVSKAKGGSEPSGYLNTGTQLVSDSPAPGVRSRNVEFGVRTCWGG